MNIYDTANNLAREIRESDVFKKLKNAKDIRKVYFFERKGKKYKSKNLIMTFDPAIIFYPSDLIKEKSE